MHTNPENVCVCVSRCTGGRRPCFPFSQRLLQCLPSSLVAVGRAPFPLHSLLTCSTAAATPPSASVFGDCLFFDSRLPPLLPTEDERQDSLSTEAESTSSSSFFSRFFDESDEERWGKKIMQSCCCSCRRSPAFFRFFGTKKGSLQSPGASDVWIVDEMRRRKAEERRCEDFQ